MPCQVCGEYVDEVLIEQVFQLEQNIEAFMCFGSNLTLTPFLFALYADGRRRKAGLIRVHWFFVHLLDLLHYLVSFLLQYFDVPGFFLHSVFHIFDFATQSLILSQQCYVLLPS